MFAKKVITSTAPEAAAEATEAVTAETVVANPLAATADGAAGGAAAATTTTGTPAAASSWFAAKPGETAPTPAASSWFAAAPAAGAVPPANVEPPPAPSVDEEIPAEDQIISVASIPKGVACDPPNVATFGINDIACGFIPIGRSTVRISDLDIDIHKSESPFNILCCAGRYNENVHMGNVKIMKHNLGARPCSTLTKYAIISILVGVIVGFALKDDKKKEDGMYPGIGAGAGVFLLLFIAWFMDRKASFSYGNQGTELLPMLSTILGPEGLKVSQFKIEKLLQASWAAWSRFRHVQVFDALKPSEDPLVTTHTQETHTCCGIWPAGADYLTIVDGKAIVIRKTEGFLNLDVFSSSSWLGFWSDDVHWVQYTRGNRTRRGFYFTIVAGLAVGLGIAFGAYTEADRSSDKATGPAAAGGAITFLVFFTLWFLSAITKVQFGLTDLEMPIVQVPRSTATDTFNEVTSVLTHREADVTNSVIRTGVIKGKDLNDAFVDILVTSDIAEVRSLSGAQNACEKNVCWLCLDESAYRVRTHDIQFVYSSIESIVPQVIFSFSYLIIGIFISVLLKQYVYTKPKDQEDALQQGVGGSFAVAILNLIYAFCNRKSVVVIGTPLQKPMSFNARVLDALGYLPPALKYMYFVEFKSLFASPEATVKDIAAAIRMARSKSHPFPPPSVKPGEHEQPPEHIVSGAGKHSSSTTAQTPSIEVVAVKEEKVEKAPAPPPVPVDEVPSKSEEVEQPVVKKKSSNDKKKVHEQEAKKLFDENELPPHWSWEETDDGEIYYTDHDGETTWDDPRDNFDTFLAAYLKAVKA
jgi:hypothetical protein